jgi:hypothetical protein
MYGKLQEQIHIIGGNILAFLPNFLAGFFLILAGLILGWLVKRIVVQLMILFRLEKLLVRFRWGEDFLKADVRYGFYRFIGGATFVIVFLIFLDGALKVWQLGILSTFLENTISIIPRLSIALIIFGIGWLIASGTSKAIHRTLGKEKIHHASLIARFSKAVLIVFFSAMALTELNFAPKIVIIGFSTIFIGLTIVFILLIYQNGNDILKKNNKSDDEE